MRKTKKAKRLSLNRQTIRTISSLKEVRGGVKMTPGGSLWGTWLTCFESCGPTACASCLWECPDTSPPIFTRDGDGK